MTNYGHNSTFFTNWNFSSNRRTFNDLCSRLQTTQKEENFQFPLFNSNERGTDRILHLSGMFRFQPQVRYLDDSINIFSYWYCLYTRSRKTIRIFWRGNDVGVCQRWNSLMALLIHLRRVFTFYYRKKRFVIILFTKSYNFDFVGWKRFWLAFW